jgi:hypothetical protein
MIRLPGEKARVKGDPVFDGNIDGLIKTLRNDVHTGYVLLENDASKGLALFNNGIMISAFHVNGNETINTGVKALIDFENIEEGNCRLHISEVSLQYLHLVKIIHLGNPLISETETKILDLRKIYETYRDTVSIGLIVIHCSDCTGLLTINSGDWKIITGKGDFDKCFFSPDCRLSLFNLLDISLFDDIEQKKSISLFLDIGPRIKEIIRKNLEETFGKTARSAVNVIASWQFTDTNYEKKLDELRKHIGLFIDTKKAGPFINDQKDEIRILIERIIQ